VPNLTKKGNVVFLGISVTPEVLKLLKQKAEKESRSVSNMANLLLSTALKSEAK
jgi:hypothetical protein